MLFEQPVFLLWYIFFPLCYFSLLISVCFSFFFSFVYFCCSSISHLGSVRMLFQCILFLGIYTDGSKQKRNTEYSYILGAWDMFMCALSNMHDLWCIFLNCTNKHWMFLVFILFLHCYSLYENGSLFVCEARADLRH